MIDSGVNFSGYSAFGGFASTGLSGGGSSFASGASSRLLDGSSGALQSLNASRGGVAQIKAALTKLRDTLSAARGSADAVAGSTTLQAVTADITHYVDQTTYVTINGKPVANGTVTVADGTQKLVVGYERVNRAPLAVRDAVKALATTVANVVAAAGQNGGNAGAGVFASQVSALLKNGDFNTAVTTPDKTSLDSAISQIDGVLASASGLGVAVSHSAAAAAQVNLGGLLLGATPSLIGGSTTTDTTTSTSSSGASAYQATSSSTTSTSSGGTVSTVA